MSEQESGNKEDVLNSNEKLAHDLSEELKQKILFGNQKLWVEINDFDDFQNKALKSKRDNLSDKEIATELEQREFAKRLRQINEYKFDMEELSDACKLLDAIKTLPKDVNEVVLTSLVNLQKSRMKIL